MKIIVREEREPLHRSGVAFRAYWSDTVPMYIGRETREELVAVLTSLFPDAVVEDAPHSPAASTPASTGS